MWGVVALVAIVYFSGAILALVDLSRRRFESWIKIVWVLIILAIPLLGILAYATVGGGEGVLVSWQRTATLLVASALALGFLWMVRGILPPFFIAFFLAALLDPVVNSLQKRGVSRGRAVLS